MKFWTLVFSLILRTCVEAHSIVFVHLGPSIPEHVPYTIQQARKFNPDCPIYLIANEAALEKSQGIEATCVTAESLTPSDAHVYFRNHTTLDVGLNGFWIYTSERFFYLEEFMSQQNLSDVFHLENDVLLYADLKLLLPAFRKNYSDKIGTTFEKDFRCVPGFLYIPRTEPLSRLVQFMAERSESGDADMVSIGKFRFYHGAWIDLLPIATMEYINDHEPLRSPGGEVSKESKSYGKFVDDFQSLFDAAALGIFLGGDDPRYHETRVGTINPNCVFNASYCQIDWELDGQGRRIPILVYKGKRTKINNLHMTNKTLIPEMVQS